MSEKYLRNQLKKIKKNWPANLRPVFLRTGEIRIVRSMSGPELQAHGIRTVKELMAQQKILEKNVVTEKEKKIVEAFVSLVQIMAKTDLSPYITFPIFEEFFPGILDAISD